MKLTQRILTLTAALTLATPAANAQSEDLSSPITITSLSMAQRRDTQDVIIKYRFTNDGVPALVRFDILTNGTSIGTENFKSVTGDFSTSLTNAIADDGNEKTITWKARLDWPGHVVTNAKAKVTAYYTNDLAYIPGIYMVVDLSKGTAATAADPYPVSYSLEPPAVNDANRTTNLWLRRIEPGTFAMGSPSNEPGHTASETLHDVTLTNDYFIGVFPVTRAQYVRVMGSAPASQNGDYDTCPVNRVSYHTIRGTKTSTAATNIDWPNTGTNVLADTFLDVLRTRTGGKLVFDLPTDAQWEYACRAGTATAWNNGTDFNTNTAYNVDENLRKLGWYNYNAKKTQPVGQQLPNAWGLYDFHGNVCEWCLDRWMENLGSESVTEPVGPASGTGNLADYRVFRNGSFYHDAVNSRSAYRITDWPGNVGSSRGFRLACRIFQ